MVGMSDQTSISRCFSEGSVAGSNQVGGLIGKNYTNAAIATSYSSGNVSGISRVGGVIGYNYNFSEAVSCVWNVDSSGLTDGVGQSVNSTETLLVGYTTAEMQDAISFTNIGWDFLGETINGTEEHWDVDDTVNNGYPHLYTAPVENEEEVYPIANALSVYPNPFTGSTRIKVSDNSYQDSEVKIYNLTGQLVNSIPIGSQQEVNWLGNDSKGQSVSSGVYFIRVQSALSESTMKVVLLK